ncbi:MAG: C45 family autoproteolytic acyltransferase/hydrolase [Granulosicoccus sp.]
MRLNFRAVDATDSAVWSGLFNEYWPDYQRWWARDGVIARPSYLAGLTAIKRHMPELVPLYQQVCDWAGGDDLRARFLSHYRPPAYMSACSQAIWPGESPMLIRNYDYNPHAFDSLVLLTRWQGRTVLGTSDCLLGLVDGMNDLGLCVSLTFGGRSVTGDGFGVPVLLRYVLQTCETAIEASEALARIPVHMSYNVTALDAKGHFRTVQLAPDKTAVITNAAVATNHQTGFQWDEQTHFTATVERERYLLQRLTLRADSEQAFKNAFLRAPLYSTAFSRGFGTLYTAAYKPEELSMHVLWPDARWVHSLVSFDNSSMAIDVPDTA